MIPLLIVTSSTNSTHSSLLLKVKTLQMGYEVHSISPDDLRAIDLINQAEKVIFRISARNYAQYQALLERLTGVKATLLERYLAAYDKNSSYRILHTSAIPQPYTESVTIPLLRQKNDFPFIVKYPSSNRGVGVYLITSPQDIVELEESYADTTELQYQEFIEESKGQDKRLFVVGNSVVAAMKRSSTDGSFKANVSAGASAESYDPTAEEREIAVRACKVLELPFAGVDIIDSNNGPLVLEVNPSPGFKIESITGVNVIEKIINYTMEKQ